MVHHNFPYTHDENLGGQDFFLPQDFEVAHLANMGWGWETHMAKPYSLVVFGPLNSAYQEIFYHKFITIFSGKMSKCSFGSLVFCWSAQKRLQFEPVVNSSNWQLSNLGFSTKWVSEEIGYVAVHDFVWKRRIPLKIAIWMGNMMI